MMKKLKTGPRIIILISITIGVIMIASAYFELQQSKEEVFHLLNEHASSLIETVSLSTVNTLNSGYEIEDLIVERLFNNAQLIKTLDSLNVLSRQELIDIAEANSLFRINIFDSKGNRILSNRIPTQNHSHHEGVVNRYKEIAPILNNKTDELVIGLKEAENSNEQRYAVAVARAKHKGAIVINLDAKSFLEFRKKIGIGKVIQDISDNPGIDFIALQDTIGIIAASKNIKSLTPILNDSIITKALDNSKIYTRIIDFNENKTYEVVKSFIYEGEVMGVFRVGLSLDEVRSIESRMNRRIIIISIILAFIAIIVLSIIFVTQNLKSVSSEYKSFKTLTSSVLENMGEAVIVVNRELKIILFNKRSEDLFNVKAGNILNKDITDLSEGKLSFLKTEIYSIENNIYLQRNIELNNSSKYLLFTLSRNRNGNDTDENFSIVIKDLTDQKILEEQAKRNEKLSAMGELASGVAHEIRNPINSIGMIAQRLSKEFEPKEEPAEYYVITKVLKDEVNRINKIITQFLNYARPIELQKKNINAKDFFEGIYYLFIDQAKLKGIRFELISNYDNEVSLDPELIKQTLMNIIQNAFDAAEKNGNVFIEYYLKNNLFNIEVKDDGKGIREEDKKKVFDLYYTTKKDGNGLGLSISQKIISQHNGTIEIEDNSPAGTKFKIKLPKS